MSNDVYSYGLDLTLPDQLALSNENVDFKKLVRQNKLKAVFGNANANFTLGVLLFAGQGIEENRVEALRHFQKAAQKQLIAAHYNLYKCYRYGLGCKKGDYKCINELCVAAAAGYLKAVKEYADINLYGSKELDVPISKIDAKFYYKKGADLGDSYCMYMYAYMLETADDSSSNKTETIKYYQMAADRNYAAAQNKIATFYYNGSGMEKNYKKAFSYFRKAAQNGYSIALINMGKMYAWGIECEKDFVAAITFWIEGIRKGANADLMQLIWENEIELSSSENGDILQSIAQLAKDYEYGWNNIARDPKKAVPLLRYAADRGNLQAYFELAVCYRYGENGIEKDENKAFSMFKEMDDAGTKIAFNELSKCYLFGVGIPQNEELAFKYSLLAAKNGNSQAMTNLAYCYANGIGTQKNPQEAFRWIRESAAKNYPPAYYNLACRYYHADGTEIDYVQAKTFFEKSYSSTKDIDAAAYLAEIYGLGKGVKVDFTEAFKWFQIAGKGNNRYGLYGLAYCYAYGKGTERDFGLALDICKKCLKLYPDYDLALDLCHKLSNDGNCLKPVSDLNEVFKNAAGNVVGEAVGWLIGSVVGTGDDD